jgi:hypothetical protein
LGVAEKPVVNVDTLTQCGQGTVALRFDIFFSCSSKVIDLIRVSIVKNIYKLKFLNCILVTDVKSQLSEPAGNPLLIL